jgi:cysteine desulfuration protein SufE
MSTTPPNALPSLPDLAEDYAFLDPDDRYRLLIDLGRTLEPMPEPLKTEATKVAGCSASVWVYPAPAAGAVAASPADTPLHFLADSNAAITKGIIALVLCAVQGKRAADVAAMDIAEALAPFDLKNQLSSNRTQGLPNMIALIKAHAARIVSLG